VPPAHGGQLIRRAEAAGDRLGPAPNGATREGRAWVLTLGAAYSSSPPRTLPVDRLMRCIRVQATHVMVS
jgi:hypothetical protein